MTPQPGAAHHIDAGAVSGKLLGAGGGFLMFFAPPETQGFIHGALADLTEVRFALDAPDSRVIFNNTQADSWRAGDIGPLLTTPTAETPAFQEVA